MDYHIIKLDEKNKKISVEEYFNFEVNKEIEKNIYNFVVDFGERYYASTIFVTFLLKTNQRVEQNNGKLALINVDDRVKRVFKILQIENFVNIFDSKEEAVQFLEA